MRKLLGIAICFFIVLHVSAASDPPLEVESETNWIAGTLSISLSVDLRDLGNPISARSKAEELFRRRIPSIFCEVMYGLQVDSYRTVKDVAIEDPEVLAGLLSLGKKSEPEKVYLDTTLEKATALYEYHFYPDIMSVFIWHSRAYEPAELLTFVPTGDYTGIVIYVKGEYPVHGESMSEESQAKLVPCLRPKIYDANMRLIAEPEMVAPEMMVVWGLAEYTMDTDYLAHKSRVGAKPLLTMAGSIFGDVETDILIPVDAADVLLASSTNRKLISSGRILIIYGP